MRAVTFMWIGILGFVVFIGIAFVFSQHKTQIDWELVIKGLLLQAVFAIILIKVPATVALVQWLSKLFVILLQFSLHGASFLFGDLARNSVENPDINHRMGFIFAFQILPTIVFFSSLTAGLYYLGILPKIVKFLAFIMSKTMKISGAESLSASGNIFLGQTEAPMLVKPFIKHMSPSELTCVMTGGMATLAGGVMAAYISFLGGNDEESKILFTSSLITASVINAPAGIVFSKIIYPETQNIQKKLQLSDENFGTNIFDALCIGASDGAKLALNVGAMLLAFISIIAFLNFGIHKIGDWLQLNDWIKHTTQNTFKGLSLEYMFGIIGCPVAYLIGIPWHESLQVGSLLGQKTTINEFVAYVSLSELQHSGQLSDKSVKIATFALCGFSNFSSVAIQLGGLSMMAPNQQSTLSRVGFYALLAASLACLSSAIWAGILL